MRTIEKAVLDPQRKLLSYLGVQFLSMKNIQDLSKNLANKITETYNPDLIVGIERGGMYPAYCLSREMQLPYITIDISRKKKYIGNIEINQISFLSKLLKKSQEKPIIKKPFKYKGSAQKAIIIDDDCGSMQTLNLAKLHIEEKGLESKTSVILSVPHGTPDFFADKQLPLSKFIKGEKRFPWSQYSPYFKDYQKWVISNQNSPNLQPQQPA